MSKIEKILGFFGRQSLQFFTHLSKIGSLSKEAFYWTIIAPIKGKGLRRKSTIDQMVLIGVNSIPIVAVICFFV